MKLHLLFVLLVIAFVSCEEQGKKNNQISEESKPEKQLTVAETIAYKNGFEKFREVNQIDFTFNVDRGNNHYERSWQWRPKQNEVTYIKDTDTVSFNRMSLDSINMQYDSAFINDKFWLLAPFNLMWDKGLSFSETKKTKAPISGVDSNLLTITYDDKGGYTPGDAYDLYYDNDFMIKEWVFRKGNDTIPSMTNTWEDYKDYNGIKIATMHKDSLGNFKLYFTGIKTH